MTMPRRTLLRLGAATTAMAGVAGGPLAARADGADTPVGQVRPVVPRSRFGPIYRTPPSAFRAVRDFPFRPRFVPVDRCGLSMGYVDAGPRDGRVVLLAHGNPAWSYTYRHWVTDLVDRGYRVIAPDLIGFGRSDKLDREQYTYQRQVDWADAFVRRLDLRDVTLFAHDWGGMIYLRTVAAMPDRFAAVAISATGLLDENHVYDPGFVVWQQQISQTAPAFGPLVEQDALTEMFDAEERAFDAPWPTEQLRGAPRQMPQQVPGNGTNPEQGAENRAALEVFRGWHKPMLTLWPENEAGQEFGDVFFSQEVPGARGMPHQTFPSGHFIQEEAISPRVLAAVVELAGG